MILLKSIGNETGGRADIKNLSEQLDQSQNQTLKSDLYQSVLQIVGVPRIGYWASCGSSLVCYLCIMLLSYFIGQKRAPIPYDLRCIGRYTLLTILLLAAYYLPIYLLHISNMWAHMGIGTVLLGIYLYVLTKRDFPIKDYLYVFRNRRNHGSSR